MGAPLETREVHFYESSAGSFQSDLNLSGRFCRFQGRNYVHLGER